MVGGSRQFPRAVFVYAVGLGELVRDGSGLMSTSMWGQRAPIPQRVQVPK